MNILYYPEINIPRTEWAIRAFLYYDGKHSVNHVANFVN